MDVTQLASLTDQVRRLPPQSAGRDRRLQRLADLHATAEAKAALETAAARAGAEPDLVESVHACAAAIGDSGFDLAAPASGDTAAWDRLRGTVCSPAFLARVPEWIRELRGIADLQPDTGACTLATALQLWLWTMNYFRAGEGASDRQAVQALDELVEGLCPVLAARCLVLEIAGPAPVARAGGGWRTDLCHVHAARAAASLGTACAELVFGYRRHLVWDAEGCATCYRGDELDALEGLMPGIASSARGLADVIEADGSHAAKAGPCVRFDGVETFTRLRARLDGCLTGARLAKTRVVASLAQSSGDAPADPPSQEEP